MIVKILSSAGSFSGVEYNESKVSLGTAEPLAVENFGLLELDGSNGSRAIHEYQQFFKAWSTNERGIIDKPQFHAVISCEGREYSGLELKAIAEQYLDKMGYKSNPYLLYFHKDTANNHIHIVSSRVDESGRKINDSFERRRSQAAIKEILGQSHGQQPAEQVAQALSYNFSSEAQFKMLLEAQGFTVVPKAGDYQFIRDGQVQHSISKSHVNDKIQNYEEPTERSCQLKALFTKYKPALTPDKFAEFMQLKFGIEVVFHTAKGKEVPYGYTIIDHAKNQVFKGSQVMALAALLTLPPREEQLKAGAEVIAVLADVENSKALRYREVKSQLSKLGFEVNSSGVVKISGENETSFSISKERMKQLFYNDRLFEAHKFNINSSPEAEIIGRVMGLKKQDFTLLGQKSQVDKKTQKLRSTIKVGELLAHGVANYENNEVNNISYFASIKTANGELTLWSKDLERAIIDGGAAIGDIIGIEHLGKQPVTVTTKVQDEVENYIEKQIQAERNTWEIKPLDTTHYEIKPSNEQERLIISDKLNSLLATGKDLGEIAKNNNYAFARKGGEVFLIDKNNHTLYNMANLSERKWDYSTVDIINCDRINPIQHGRELEYSSGTFAEIAGLVLGVLQDNPEEENPDKKRKRKRKD